MFDTITGLPVHPLIIHAVVVLGPLAALMAVAYAAVPKWRAGLRWPTAALVVIAALSGFVAEQSGEKLEHRIGDPAYGHADAGELAALSLWVLAGVTLVVIFLLARVGKEGAKALGVLALVATILSAGFVGYAVVNAGHSGAKSVWKGEISNTTPSSDEQGDNDDDGD